MKKLIIIFINLFIAVIFFQAPLNSADEEFGGEFDEDFMPTFESPEEESFFNEMFQKAQKFLEGLEKPVSAEATPGKEEEFEPPVPAKTTPYVPEFAEKQQPTIIEKIEAEVESAILPSKQLLNLNRLLELSNKLANKAQTQLFGIEFRDSLRPFIIGHVKVLKQGKKSPTSTTTSASIKTMPDISPDREISTKEEKPIEKVSYEDSGLIGLDVLVKDIRSKKAYRVTLAKKEFSSLHKKVDAILNTLTDLLHDIEQLESKYPRLDELEDEEELLRQYLKPKEKRIKKTPKMVVKKQDERTLSDIKRRVLKYFKEDIPNILKELEKLVTGPEAMKMIEEKRKKRDDASRRSQAQPYSTGYSPYYPSTQPSYTSPYSPRGYERYDDYGSYPSSYQSPYSSYPQTYQTQPTTPSESSSQIPEPSKSKPKAYRPSRAKAPKTKTAPETLSLDALIKKTTNLLEGICNTIKPTTKIDDNVIAQTLDTQSDNIKELENYLTRISQSSLRLRQAGKEKPEQKAATIKKEDAALVARAETELNDKTLQCAGSLIKLSKAGYVRLEDNPAGMFDLKLGHPIQPTLRIVYERLKKRLPKSHSSQMQNREKEVVKEIESYVKTTFTLQLRTMFIPTKQDDILKLDIANLEKLSAISRNLLQLAIATKNQPSPFTFTAQDTKNIKLDSIANLENFVHEHFNEAKFKNVVSYQEKHFGEFGSYVEKTVPLLLQIKLIDTPEQCNALLYQYFTNDTAWQTNILVKFQDQQQAKETLNKTRKHAQYAYMALVFNYLDQILKMAGELRKQLSPLIIPQSKYAGQPITSMQIPVFQGKVGAISAQQHPVKGGGP